MKAFLFCFQFNGGFFYGTQIQKSHLTVTGLIKDKLTSSFKNVKFKLSFATRLDRDVHATQMYGVIYLPSLLTISAFNLEKILTFSNKKFNILFACEVSPLFQLSKKIKYKCYTVKFLDQDYYNNHFLLSSLYYQPLDFSKFNQSLANKFCNLLTNHQNFAFLQKQKEQHISPIINTFMMKYIIKNQKLTIVFVGNRFLRYMVRIISYLFIAFSQQQISLNHLDNILKNHHKFHSKISGNNLYLHKCGL